MRIAVVSSPFVELQTNRYGANERTIVERVQALRDAGHHVVLVAPDAGPALPNDLRRTRRILHPLPNSSLEKVSWVLSPKTYFQLLAYLSVDLADVDLVINDGVPLDPLNTYLVAQRFGLKRTLNVLHGNLSLDSVWQQSSNALSRGLVYGAQNTNLCREMSSRGYFVYYSPTGAFFPPESEVTESPERRLIHLGRISPFKGTHLAIELAARLGRKLLIVGPVGDAGYFRRSVQPMLGDSVEYRGELDRADLVDLLRTSEGLLFTSTGNDSQGLVLLEALSFGLPIIATRPGTYSGLFDILIEGQNGALVDLTRPDMSSAEAVLNANRREIRAAAAKLWDWRSVIANHYNPIFEQLSHSSEHAH